jgi:hypothetical protein
VEREVSHPFLRELRFMPKPKNKNQQDMHTRIDKDLYKFVGRHKIRLNALKDGKYTKSSVVEIALRMLRDAVEGAAPVKILPRAS